MRRRLIVCLGEGALELSGLNEADSTSASERLATAAAALIASADRRRPGWTYPDASRERRPAVTRELEVSIEADLWVRFGAEAERQGLSTDQLLEHALLRFAAAADANSRPGPPGPPDPAV